MNQPLDEVMSLAPFAPRDAPPVAYALPGSSIQPTAKILPSFRMLVVTRLWLWDGMWGEANGQPLHDGPAALGGFRLVGESGTKSIWQTVGVPFFKLFQVVPGVIVRVRGAPPRGRVEASTVLVTNAGRRLEWVTHDFAGADGTATLRLPYSTGGNGAVMAAPWLVKDGRRETGLALTEREVLFGATVELKLGR